MNISKKKIVLILCFIGYTCSYLCRTNISISLPYMMGELNFSKVSGGLIGSVYFWSYAFGQLINGAISERVSPKFFVILGLFGASICNVAIGVSNLYWFIVFFWGLNGFFLSMLWCAMVKILTAWYKGDEYRRASFIVSLPTVVGYILSWGIMGSIISYSNWRVAFIIPAVITGIFILVWIVFLVEKPETDIVLSNDEGDIETVSTISNKEFMKQMLVAVIIVVGFTGIFQGVIKEGINLWLPTILQENKTVSSQVASLFSVIVPIMGAIGIMATSWLLQKSGKSGDTMFVLLISSFFATIVIWWFNSNFIVSIIFMGVLLAAMSGCNVIITGIVPLRFLSVNRCAQTSGILNFLIYVGAAVGGVASGYINVLWGWSGMYIFWIVLCWVSCLGVYAVRNQLNLK